MFEKIKKGMLIFFIFTCLKGGIMVVFL